MTKSSKTSSSKKRTTITPKTFTKGPKATQKKTSEKGNATKYVNGKTKKPKLLSDEELDKKVKTSCNNAVIKKTSRAMNSAFGP